MEESVSKVKLHVFAVPGQNGLGSDPEYIKGLLGENSVDVTPVATPLVSIDFGQSNCINMLKDAVEKNSDSRRQSIIHATSQGTATALNYLAHVDKGRQIKALILEATLGSGNSAIHHTVSGPLMDLKKITDIPSSYYWLPYIAKAKFPLYSPSGKQAIKSIAQIPTHIPIIIVHSKNDPQLSYNDACALYYGLRMSGNKNVYFISKNGRDHIEILSSFRDKYIIQEILKKHELLANSESMDNINLSDYQPDHKNFRTMYQQLLQKEKKHEQLGTVCTGVGIGVGISAAILALSYFAVNVGTYLVS